MNKISAGSFKYIYIQIGILKNMQVCLSQTIAIALGKQNIFEYFNAHVVSKSTDGKSECQSAKCKHCGITVYGSVKAASNFVRYMMVSTAFVF